MNSSDDSSAPTRFRSGVCSITFRQMSIPEVAGITARAGLDAIEWGGDLHVKPGDLSAARAAREATVGAGLTVSSYGSYYRVLLAENKAEDFSPVLESALELGTQTIRIWPGVYPSEIAPAGYRQRFIETLRPVLDRARQHGVRLAFEFHANTLTDSNYSAVELLREIDHPNLFIYWQPMYWVADPIYRLAGLEQLKDRILNLHVFHWSFQFAATPGDAIKRLPLCEGEASWRRYLRVPLCPDIGHFALMEFVRDNDPDAFIEDAAALKSWL